MARMIYYIIRWYRVSRRIYRV